MKIGALTALAAALSLSGIASAADAPAATGRTVFEHWCMPCHGAGPGHPGTAALEVKYKGEKPATLEQRTDLTPDVVRYYVRNGISVMAPFRKTEITDAELDDLAAYLASPKP